MDPSLSISTLEIPWAKVLEVSDACEIAKIPKISFVQQRSRENAGNQPRPHHKAK
jgi:hypothetical protein